jgi:hypothetical protein
MVAVPKGAKVPEDHKSAAQIDAEGIGMTDVAWRGHVFTIMSDADDYPTPAVMAFELGQNVRGLGIVLGPKQYAEFLKAAPTKRDVNDFLEVMGEALGLGN